MNFDPAAEYFDYAPIADVRDLIQVEDILEDEDLNLGKCSIINLDTLITANT